MPSRTLGIKATPDDVKDFLRIVIKANLRNASEGRPTHPATIWGHRGVGKTDVVKQLHEEGFVQEIVYIALAQIEEMGDLIGLPEVVLDEVSQKRVTIIRPPHWVPKNDVPGIILFDDFNRTDVRIIKGVMQLLQRSEMVSWKLPPSWTIILTANPEDQTYLVTGLDPAMLTRMYSITMVPDSLIWLKWAAKHNVDPRVMSFIAKYKEYLAPDGAERTCPRSWKMFADAIIDIESNRRSLSGQLDTLMVMGLSILDELAVSTFMQFINGELDEIVEPEVIMRSYTSSPEIQKKIASTMNSVPTRNDVLYAILSRLVAYISTFKPNTLQPEWAKNVVAFLEEDWIPKDMKTIIVQNLAKSPMAHMLTSKKLSQHLVTALTTS